MLVGAALLTAGCGSEAVSYKKAGPPAPKKCLDRFNADPTALSFGRHAHGPGHDSRAGHVFFVNKPRIGLVNTCVVVFAASESDREYGILGEFSSEIRSIETGLLSRPWQYINVYPGATQQEKIALQRTGAEQANVALDKHGKITPLE